MPLFCSNSSSYNEAVFYTATLYDDKFEQNNASVSMLNPQHTLSIYSEWLSTCWSLGCVIAGSTMREGFPLSWVVLHTHSIRYDPVATCFWLTHAHAMRLNKLPGSTHMASTGYHGDQVWSHLHFRDTRPSSLVWCDKLGCQFDVAACCKTYSDLQQ